MSRQGRRQLWDLSVVLAPAVFTTPQVLPTEEILLPSHLSLSRQRWHTHGWCGGAWRRGPCVWCSLSHSPCTHHKSLQRHWIQGCCHIRLSGIFMRSHVIHERKDNRSKVTTLKQETSSPLELKFHQHREINKYLLDTQYVHRKTAILLFRSRAGKVKHNLNSSAWLHSCFLRPELYLSGCHAGEFRLT